MSAKICAKAKGDDRDEGGPGRTPTEAPVTAGGAMQADPGMAAAPRFRGAAEGGGPAPAASDEGGDGAVISESRRGADRTEIVLTGGEQSQPDEPEQHEQGRCSSSTRRRAEDGGLKNHHRPS